MAAYGNVKVKVFVHDAQPGDETGAVGTLATDVQEYIDTLDSSNNKILSVTHTKLNGDRVLTMVCGGA